MKTITKEPVFFILLTALLFSVISCSKENGNVNNTGNGNTKVLTLQAQINSLPKEALSSAESNSLIWMREEEKLARDVYITLYNKWGVNVFTNISNSEQSHMDAILMLLNKYNLTDPVVTSVGVFNNPALQDLYTTLVAQGSTSLPDAYKVGATIEDLDIFDLTNALADNDNQDIRLVYDNLTKGSRNHMRSFYTNILNIGGTYTPLYISQTTFDAIISSTKETGF